jgi:hypothetical protein
MSQTKQRRTPLRDLFLLDVLSDRRARPALIYAAVLIGLGATFYHLLEGWSWIDSLYFVVITLATIGYGDLHPTLPITKLFTIFYVINGIVMLLTVFDVIRRVRGMELDGQAGEADEPDK